VILWGWGFAFHKTESRLLGSHRARREYMRRPRVLLADDHPMMLEGLRKLLEPSCDVAGMVMDGHALLAAVERLRPDLVISDISMPDLDGLAATRRLRATHPGVRVLILSIHIEHSWVNAAFEAGASGYLTKTSAPEEIEHAVHEVLEGRFFVSSAVTQGVVAASVKVVPQAPRRPPPETGETLTPRETDIVRLVGQGLGNKEIARRLGVSVTTVRTHLSKVYDKIGTASRVELAIFAAQTGGMVM
jgi:DNA-binding NarL/FixJ family response regulator